MKRVTVREHDSNSRKIHTICRSLDLQLKCAGKPVLYNVEPVRPWTVMKPSRNWEHSLCASTLWTEYLSASFWCMYMMAKSFFPSILPREAVIIWIYCVRKDPRLHIYVASYHILYQMSFMDWIKYVHVYFFISFPDYVVWGQVWGFWCAEICTLYEYWSKVWGGIAKYYVYWFAFCYFRRCKLIS